MYQKSFLVITLALLNICFSFADVMPYITNGYFTNGFNIRRETTVVVWSVLSDDGYETFYTAEVLRRDDTISHPGYITYPSYGGYDVLVDGIWYRCSRATAGDTILNKKAREQYLKEQEQLRIQRAEAEEARIKKEQEQEEARIKRIEELRKVAHSSFGITSGSGLTGVEVLNSVVTVDVDNNTADGVLLSASASNADYKNRPNSPQSGWRVDLSGLNPPIDWSLFWGLGLGIGLETYTIEEVDVSDSYCVFYLKVLAGYTISKYIRVIASATTAGVINYSLHICF
jgi:hypothetical protein